MKKPYRLSLLGMRKQIENGSLTVPDLISSCLERMLERNDDVKAFTYVDEIAINTVLKRFEKQVSKPNPLFGLPFAAKDVFDSCDFITEYGSPIYHNYRPPSDASVIALTKEQGALLIGKTVTCEFATVTPSPTRNPLSLNHTPGGSSSGSAAAVADFMVPVAFSTQTAGSTIRPAVYCGVVGFKSTYGYFNTSGLKTLSPTADTVGLITRSVEDAAFFSSSLHGTAVPRPQSLENVKIKIVKSSQWDYADKGTIDAIESFVKKLEAESAIVSTVSLSQRMEKFHSVQSDLTFFEIRQSLAYERLNHLDKISPQLQHRLMEPLKQSVIDYFSLVTEANSLRQHVDSMFDDADILVYPAAEGEAEIGLEYTGSHRFCGFWTLMHLPAISFPIGVGDAGLPLGVQLFGKRGSDTKLLATAMTAANLSDFNLSDYLK